MMHLPSIVVVSFYFSRHRALATSVVLCGSGVGKFVFAPLSRYLIDKYGWRGANCILGAIVLHGAACGCVFRPVTVTQSGTRPRPPSPHRRTGCVIMQKILAEKRRRRRDSTGSLDGTMITSDGRLLSPSIQPVGSASRPRTVRDPSSADDSPLRTFSVDNQQLLGQHSLSDQPSCSVTALGSSAVRTRTVSDPASNDISLRTLSRHRSSTDQLSSSTLLQTVAADNSDTVRTFSDPVTLVPDIEVAGEESSTRSETSDPSMVVWVELDNRNSSTVLNSSRVEPSESERCSNLIEMTDIIQHGPASLIHRPPGTSGPPSVLAPLSSRPHLFYTDSCLQVGLFFHS